MQTLHCFFDFVTWDNWGAWVSNRKHYAVYKRKRLGSAFFLLNIQNCYWLLSFVVDSHFVDVFFVTYEVITKGFPTFIYTYAEVNYIEVDACFRSALHNQVFFRYLNSNFFKRCVGVSLFFIIRSVDFFNLKRI